MSIQSLQNDIRVPSSIPAAAGVGLRAEHYRDVVENDRQVPWFEIHSENYFGHGGIPHHYLKQIRQTHPISFHGVGLSLGSADPLNEKHLNRLRELIDQYEPGLISEHLSWSSIGGTFLNDLLPLPYSEESLRHLGTRILEVQDRLQQRILVENASTYLQYHESSIPEWEFLNAVAQQADCDILLDVNNIYVNSVNHEFDPLTFISTIDANRVKEIHLAGHTVNAFDDGSILIDTHNQLICDAVWELYTFAIQRFPGTPTLIEWDTDLPEFQVLVDEAQHAQHIMDMSHASVA